MSNTSAGRPYHPGRYEIRLQGHLGSRWAARFDGMTLTTRADGTTVIDVTRDGLDFWRQGDYIRGKWGIYRGKSDVLKVGEDTVRFANFAITKGTGAPATNCR